MEDPHADRARIIHAPMRFKNLSTYYLISCEVINATNLWMLILHVTQSDNKTI